MFKLLSAVPALLKKWKLWLSIGAILTALFLLYRWDSSRIKNAYRDGYEASSTMFEAQLDAIKEEGERDFLREIEDKLGRQSKELDRANDIILKLENERKNADKIYSRIPEAVASSDCNDIGDDAFQLLLDIYKEGDSQGR